MILYLIIKFIYKCIKSNYIIQQTHFVCQNNFNIKLKEIKLQN